MIPTRALFARSPKLTLFTRVNCGLCDTAKHNVQQVRKRRPFEYTELDIMEPANKAWKDVYEFDVPVLHIQGVKTTNGKQDVSEPKKLFHRFSASEVEAVVDEAEKTD